MKNDFFEKTKGKKTRLIIGLIIILICIGVETFLFIKRNNDIENAKPLIAMEEDSNSNTYAYIDAELMTDYFATYTYDNSPTKYYYFIWDDKYIYIASLSKEQKTKLKDIYDYSYDKSEDAIKPEKVRVYGYTKTIPKDLKKFAAKSMNEMYDKTDYTESNITNYVGVYYLDTTDTPDSNLTIYSIVTGIVSLIGFYQIYVYFKNKKKMNKIMEKYSQELEKINSEIDGRETLYVKEAKIYLTKNYIVSLVNGFEIYKYQDIRWFYPYEYKYNGQTANKSIMIVTNDSITHTIANISYNKKNRIKFDEIYSTLETRLPDVMNGYTQENIEKNKELSKR